MSLRSCFLSTLLLATCINVFAQAPESIKYQAAARDLSGNPLASASIQVRISVLDASASGPVIYQENHAVTTSNLGLYNLNIGQGTVLQGTFSAINWGSGAKFIQQEVNFGSGYTNMGTSQFLSVPYALYAETAGNGGTQGPQGEQGPQGIQGIPGNDGISVNWLGTYTTAPSSPSTNDAYYNSTDGVSYIWNGSTWSIVAQDGTEGSATGNTLNEAYNEGAPGAGRIITADNGSVTINGSGTGVENIGLLVNHNGSSTAALGVNFSGTGNAIQAVSTNAGNTTSTIQASTNSSTGTNSALFGQSTGAARAIAGQVESSATADVAVKGLNLRTSGGIGVEGVGFNGVSGTTQFPGGIGVYGSNTGVATGGPASLGIGTYGSGFHGIYGQTNHPNGWGGWFTADLGVEGTGYALGGWINASDKRLKSNITAISSPLDQLLGLEGKHYTISYNLKNQDGHVTKTQRQEYGLIAQDVEMIFPEMVVEKAILKNTGDDTMYKSINYTQLIPVLVEAVKELKQEVDDLRHEIEMLKQ